MRVGRRRFLVASHFNCPSGSISSTLAMAASHFNCPSILNSHHPINKCEYSLFFLPACRHHTTTLYHHSPKCCALLAIFHAPRAGSSLFPPPAYFRRLSMRVAYLFPPFLLLLRLQHTIMYSLQRRYQQQKMVTLHSEFWECNFTTGVVLFWSIQTI